VKLQSRAYRSLSAFFLATGKLMGRKGRQGDRQTNIPARIDNLQGGCVVVVGIDFQWQLQLPLAIRVPMPLG